MSIQSRAYYNILEHCYHKNMPIDVLSVLLSLGIDLNDDKENHLV